MATPTSLPATFVAGNVLTAAQMNDLRGAFRILQVVRATDTTNRSTTSSSFVDASISVTITPTAATSDIIVIWTLQVGYPSGSDTGLQITDSSNVALSGAENFQHTNPGGFGYGNHVLVGYASPATTSATTYKGRFRTPTGSFSIYNSTLTTGQLIAMEVSA
jgi:hypothetical protein